MAETRLDGGPCDGETVEIGVGQVEVVQDGCTYRHRACDGFYVYVEGEKTSASKRRAGKAKDTED